MFMSYKATLQLRHGKTKQVSRILTIATDLSNVVMNVTTEKLRQDDLRQVVVCARIARILSIFYANEP